ncbi:MAG: amino acid adenylation domain-containing protein [Cytophagales bacterium]|nr:amino acid adenylation domain-containing protein [Cytophagales bacterium]
MDDIVDVYPMSDIQKGMIFHSIKEGGVYHDQMLHLLKIEHFNVEIFQKALALISWKHAMLRTSFSMEKYDEPLQFVHKGVAIDYLHQNLTDLLTDQQEKFIESELQMDKSKPFDLSRPGAWRYRSYALGDNNFAVCFIFHHAILDGWSNASFSTELHDIYFQLLKDPGYTPTPLKSSYKDFIIEQRLQKKNNHGEEFWKQELDDYTRFAFDEKEDIATFKHANAVIGAEVYEQLVNYSRTHHLNTKSVCYAAFLYCLRLYAHSSDITAGLITNNRPAIEDGEKVLGCFLNTVPFRYVFEQDQTWHELVKSVHDKLIQLKKYDHLSLLEISKLVDGTTDEENPIVDVIFNYIDFHVYDQINDHKPEQLNGNSEVFRFNAGSYERTNFGMAFTVSTTDGLISCTLSYLTSYVSDGVVEDFLALYERVIKEIAARANDPIKKASVFPDDIITSLTASDQFKIGYPTTATLVSLFEEQVTQQADKVALIYGEESVSYHDLNVRSNQLAAYLKYKGVTTGSIVGLLLDDPLQQVISILGTLKASGCYLPIDTSHPDERIGYMLDDSTCKMVLTNTALASARQQLLEGRVVVLVSDEKVQTYSGENLVREVGSSDLAYIIYTSGTTGRPKGAMIEHRQVVRLFFNESPLFDFGPSDVWTMFHSYSFDFSVWEMYGALLHGGKLVLLSREVARDPGIYHQLLADHGVTILNQTPTAFQSLQAQDHLKGDNSLQVRKVIFGGEKLIPSVIRSWKEKYPETEMINMYGITETTVHVTYKLLTASDLSSSVSNIGKPIPTTQVHVLDDQGQLSLPGVKGELYVGGDGVCRGYLNNSELTEEKFIPNPFQGGGRLYKTGDAGRWLPNGELEYLGRIDNQVQVRGYRIETGEIETHLLAHEWVKEAVVTSRGEETDINLVGYYVSEEELSVNTLRSHLSHQLPSYMIPAYFVHLDQMPLTGNGKVDLRALPEPEATAQEAYIAPRNPEEALLCEIWQSVLSIEKIGIGDNFFTVGGDSIKSIQIISRLRASGYELSVKDIFSSQTIEVLAPRMRLLTREVDQSPVTGYVPLTGIQAWFFAQPLQAAHHFNQSVLLNFPNGITEATVRTIFDQLQRHHDAFRMSYSMDTSGVHQENKGIPYPLTLTYADLSSDNSATATLSTLCQQEQEGIDLKEGPLLRLGLFDMPDGSRLQVVVHHLVMDGVSWRVLFEDIDSLYRQIEAGKSLQLPPKTDSYKSWSEGLRSYMKGETFKNNLSYWQEAFKQECGDIPKDTSTESNRMCDTRTVHFQLDAAITTDLLTTVHKPFNTQINDMLLSGLILGAHEYYGNDSLRVDLEGHGREEIVPDLDISRTIGWFTSIYSVELSYASEMSAVLKGVKERLRSIPQNGADYLLARYVSQELPEVDASSQTRISFNYLGQFDGDTEGRVFEIASESSGLNHSEEEIRFHDWDFTGMVAGGQLTLSLTYNKEAYSEEKVRSFMSAYQSQLRSLITYCQGYVEAGRRELTPSDLSYKGLTLNQLSHLQTEYRLKDVYPLSPMQEGLLFHALSEPDTSYYFEQVSYRLEGQVDQSAVEQSLLRLASRYDILRTVFVSGGHDRPLQVVQEDGVIGYTYEDLREEVSTSRQELEEILQGYREADRSRGFDLSKGPLMRVSIYRLSEAVYEFVWSHHHILMDGWCMSILINEFGALYSSKGAQQTLNLPSVLPYSDYIMWLEGRDMEASSAYWSKYLSGYATRAMLPGKHQIQHTSTNPDKTMTRLVLDREQTSGLQEVCQGYGVTLNTMIQGIWGILLSRYNDTNDVVFGTVVSGRPAEVKGIEEMVGLFINTIPVRVGYEQQEGLEAYLKRLQDQSLASEPHHYQKLSEIQSMSELGQDLIDHILVFENYPISEQIEDDGEETSHDYVVSGTQIYEETHYDLSVTVLPGEEIIIDIKYNRNRYEDFLISGVKTHLTQLVFQITSNKRLKPSEIDLLSDKESVQLIDEFNQTDQPYPQHMSLLDLFEETVTGTPEEIALIHNDIKVTYRELNEKAERMAAQLQQANVKQGDIVALLIDRSVELVVGILATLKLGATYLPLDIKQPEKRIRYLLSDSNTVLLLSEHENVSLYSDQVNVMDVWSPEESTNSFTRSSDMSSTDIAYIIYTSGSTGLPKGVMIEHRSVVNLVHSLTNRYGLQRGERILLFANISFDTSVEQMWLAFSTGSSLILVDNSTLLNTTQFNDYLAKNHVTHLNTTPSFLAGMEVKPLESFNRIIVGGEKCPLELAEKYSSYCDFYNSYGPTEATVTTHTCIFHPETHDTPVIPLGRQNANVKIYVLSKDRKLQPVGVPGEIYIGGDCLSRGYLNNQKLTENKFVDSPFHEGEKIYSSGDLGKWLPNGHLEYLGRVEQQLKIRGFRVEPGEIEYHLVAHESIREAAVVPIGDKDVSLSAYYTSDHELSRGEIRFYLSERVPEYMIPRDYVHMDKLPLTSNGKLDTKALPAPQITIEGSYVAPANEVEAKLIHLWQEVLNVEATAISTDSNFFEIGGTSIKLVQLQEKMKQTFETDINVATIFRSPTVASLAEFLMKGDTKIEEINERVDASVSEADDFFNTFNQ